MELVLVIDSAADVRNRLAELVRSLAPGVRVMEAQNGKDGVMLAVMERPDLILLGSDMPIMDGYETAHRLRSMPRTKKIPLIAIADAQRQSYAGERLHHLVNGAVSTTVSLPEFGGLLRGVVPATGTPMYGVA